MRSEGAPADLLTSIPPMRVDGMTPAEFVQPGTPRDVADILAAAGADGRAVIPFGGGTKLSLGNVPERADIGLSTLGLNRVLHFEPTDLTLSVESGMRFADLQAVLAEQGKTLPVDAVDAERATIGGLVASALSGPRRLGNGTLRDLLIGVAVAYPNGTVAKAGGLVVKNVTGFDLMRLHHGALGTLGVMVALNFKVMPLPRSESTVIAEFASFAEGMAASDRVRASRVRPAALDLVDAGDSWRVAVCLGGRETTVKLLAGEVRDLMADARTLETAESSDWWQAHVSGTGAVEADSAHLRCGGNPSAAALTGERILRVLHEHDISHRHFSIEPLNGITNVRFGLVKGHPRGSAATRLRALQIDLLAVADHVTVVSAPTPWKRGIDVWGRVPETIDVMRALKAEFDPGRTINPGRYVDGI